MLSVAIISHNSERLISKCIKSVIDISDDIVVVDSFSEDRTPQIAESLGARVIKREFRDFYEQKNFAVSLCKNEWVLSLDSDEIVSEELRNEIAKKIDFKNIKYSGFLIRRRNIYLGKTVHVWSNYVPRLFRKSRAMWKGEIVHESVEIQGKIGKLKGDIIHYTYSSCKEHFAKTLNFGEKSAIKKYLQGERGYRIKLLITPFWEFFKHFILKMGFTDGTRGLIISYSAMIDRIIRYSLLWEKNEIRNYEYEEDPQIQLK